MEVTKDASMIDIKCATKDPYACQKRPTKVSKETNKGVKKYIICDAWMKVEYNRSCVHQSHELLHMI